MTIEVTVRSADGTVLFRHVWDARHPHSWTTLERIEADGLRLYGYNLTPSVSEPGVSADGHHDRPVVRG